MGRALRVLCGLIVASCVGGAVVGAQEDMRYARCNLKVIDGTEITWINWQAAPTFLPVNTKFRVTRSGDKATLVEVGSGTRYTLDIGADGEGYLEKFVAAQPVNVRRFSEAVQQNIAKAVAKVGMTKEEVYIAMGPPTNLGRSRSNTMTYDAIMAGDSWIYARRRFGKNIGVAFDSTGVVTRTEGIWGKD
jgi:hypothetical protein